MSNLVWNKFFQQKNGVYMLAPPGPRAGPYLRRGWLLENE